MSRRAFAVGGLAAVTAAALAGCSVLDPHKSKKRDAGASTAPSSAPSSTPGSSATPAGAIIRAGYFMVLNQGRWVGPTDSSGAPSTDLIDAVLEQRSGAAMPEYLRVTSAAPSGANTPAAGSAELQALQRLTAAGIHLGVAIGTAPKSKAIAASDVIAHATQVRQASEQLGGLYDWIFLDEAVEHTPGGSNGLNDLQSIVDGVAAAGWERIMINATGFQASSYQYLPQRTWGAARHFGLISPDATAATVASVVSSGSGAVVAGDQQFISYVNQHLPGTTPILKLEVPSTSSVFARFSQSDQAALLNQWAQDEAKDDYRTIYPLYIPGGNSDSGKSVEYNSLTAGTFWQQRTLMQQYG